MNPFKTSSSKDCDDEVARSQFNILLALSKLSNAVVFAEGESKDRTLFSNTDTSIADFPFSADRIFPKSVIPESFEQATPTQRQALFKIKAVTIAGALGFISEIKAVDDQAKLNDESQWIANKIISLVGEPDPNLAWDLFFKGEEYHSRIFLRREAEVKKRDS